MKHLVLILIAYLSVSATVRPNKSQPRQAAFSYAMNPIRLINGARRDFTKEIQWLNEYHRLTAEAAKYGFGTPLKADAARRLDDHIRAGAGYQPFIIRGTIVEVRTNGTVLQSGHQQALIKHLPPILPSKTEVTTSIELLAVRIAPERIGYVTLQAFDYGIPAK